MTALWIEEDTLLVTCTRWRQISSLKAVDTHAAKLFYIQFNIVGGGMHQVGLQTENSQKERRRNTCLWLLQVRASLHWCMESTLLLCLFFYHLTSFLLQQLMCAAIFLTRGSYMKHSSSLLCWDTVYAGPGTVTFTLPVDCARDHLFIQTLSHIVNHAWARHAWVHAYQINWTLWFVVEKCLQSL